MARRNPTRKPPAELVKLKRDEKESEAQALVDVGAEGLDSESFKRFLAAKVIEQIIESQARPQAFNLLRVQQRADERRRHSEYPYNIGALLRPRDGRALYEHAKQRTDEITASAESIEERDRFLGEELQNARQFTLSLAERTKDLLDLHTVTPDTEVSRTHTTEEKKWQGWGKFILGTGKIRNPVTVQQHSHVANGWLLNFPNSRRGTGQVVLCEDGRLLAVNGIVEDSPTLTPSHPRPERRLKFEGARGGARYINATPGADAAAPPLIPRFEDNPYSHTVDMLNREAAIQDALVNLLVDKGVEFPGPASSPSSS